MRYSVRLLSPFLTISPLSASRPNSRETIVGSLSSGSPANCRYLFSSVTTSFFGIFAMECKQRAAISVIGITFRRSRTCERNVWIGLDQDPHIRIAHLDL
jgi:hypothetical protein